MVVRGFGSYQSLTKYGYSDGFASLVINPQWGLNLEKKKELVEINRRVVR